jgi:uncharacterized protein YndB with AHSA1/START domain
VEIAAGAGAKFPFLFISSKTARPGAGLGLARIFPNFPGGTMQTNQENLRTGRSVQHKQSTSESPLVEVTMNFRAPAKAVFEALSTPALVQEWWGPETYFCPHAESDFRVGGKYLFAMESEKDGQVMWSTGHYLEIEPDRKIVYSDSFANSKGEPISAAEAGMKDFPDWGEGFVTLELEAVGQNETNLLLSHEGIPARMHDDCVEGWTSSLNKLKRVVERH